MAAQRLSLLQKRLLGVGLGHMTVHKFGKNFSPTLLARK